MVQFPSEILHQVLSLLDTPSIITSASVSKHWNFLATKVLQHRTQKIVNKFKTSNLNGHVIYGINPLNGQLSKTPLSEENLNLSHEEIIKMKSILYDNESNIRAKLRGIRISSYNNHFTILKEDSFMSKKPRMFDDKNRGFRDFSKPKELFHYVTLIEQHREEDEFRSSRVRQSFAVSQCGNILVIGRCEQRHGLRFLNSITCNIAEAL